MVGEKVTHIRFGRGMVTAFASPRIEITFEDGAVKTFAYPQSVERFIRFEREEAQQRAKRDREQAEVLASERAQEIIREKRQRAEEEARRRVEANHEKKVAAARRIAARRKPNTTTGGQTP